MARNTRKRRDLRKKSYLKKRRGPTRKRSKRVHTLRRKKSRKMRGGTDELFIGAMYDVKFEPKKYIIGENIFFPISIGTTNDFVLKTDNDLLLSNPTILDKSRGKGKFSQDIKILTPLLTKALNILTDYYDKFIETTIPDAEKEDLLKNANTVAILANIQPTVQGVFIGTIYDDQEKFDVKFEPEKKYIIGGNIFFPISIGTTNDFVLKTDNNKSLSNPTILDKSDGKGQFSENIAVIRQFAISSLKYLINSI